MKHIDVTRSTVTLDPDRTHVLARPFRVMSDQRSRKISTRVMALSENEVHSLLEGVRAEFGDRQLKIDEFLRRRFNEVGPDLLNGQILSEERKLLLGGYFTHEYSLEAAALFNPSMVPHLDQSGVPPCSMRFILSLRATAEGHISSVAFRSGMLDANGHVTMDVPSRYSLEPRQVPNSSFEKPLFERKLRELRLIGDFNREVLNGLPDVFTMEELRASISRASTRLPERERETTKGVATETLMLARSNYEVQFTPESGLTWTVSDMEDLVMKQPRLAMALLRILVERNAELTRQIESFSVDSTERRLARSLIRFSERLGTPEEDGSVRMMPFTQELLSRYVGTSRELVNHHMNRFRKRGYVSYSRHGMVLNPGALKASIG